MTEMFGEAWPPMSDPDLAPDNDDDDDDDDVQFRFCQPYSFLILLPS